MLSLEDFIAIQESCLKIEREEEISRGSHLEECNFKELESHGSALTNLLVQGSRTGLYGRCILSLVSKRVPPVLPSHSITSGDIVKLIGQRGKEENPSGVITSLSPSSICVSLDEDSVFDPHDESTYTIIKVANDVTYKRLKGALTALSQSDNRTRLESILFGLGSMSPPHVNHAPKLLNANGELQYFNANLNPSQRSAVEFALQQKEIGIVHGPPGTGKTTTVVEIISQAVKSGSRVLCTAPSNVAVDNLLERLVRNKLKCVRIGHPARISTDLQKYSLDALINASDQTQIVRDVRKDIDAALKNPRKNWSEIKELRKECRSREGKAIKEIFSKAQVILSTLVSSDPLQGPLKVLRKKDGGDEYFFDLVVIDECSQALELSCWIALPQAPKAILSGDHCQLPPTVMSQEAASKGFAYTLMERLVKSHPDAVRLLEMQYRMNSLIMDWSSKEFYDSQLKAGSEEVAGRVLKSLQGISGEGDETSLPIIFIDTAGCDCPESSTEEGQSKANEGEAGLVVEHVRRLVESGLSPRDIAVITPYNLQVELIRSQFSNGEARPEVRTVDGFQGQEKEAVILSLVRSNKKGNVGFLAEARRLNVAVTRAKRHLAIICDSETLTKGDSFLKRFVEYMGEVGDVRSAAEYSTEDIVKLTVKKRPQPIAKKSAPKSKKTTAAPKKKSDPPKESSPKPPPVIGVGEELEDPRVQEYRELINEFVRNKEAPNYKFDSGLNSHERMLVHSLVEKEFCSLSHESVGEGKDRCIVLKRKAPSVTAKPKVPSEVRPPPKKQIPRGNKFEALKEDKPPPTPKEPVEENDVVERTRCPKCGKSVPQHNLTLHDLRCKPPAPKAPVKKAQIPNTDDFDEICDAFAKLDKVCNATGCKTKVGTLGMNCRYCVKRFCLSHGMAEIHGCGDEARKAARKQIVREGKIYPGSGKPDRSIDKVKRVQLAKRLDKKINEKVDERKVKKKDK